MTRTLQIPALTGLRAVAAGMVFFFHWLFDTPNAWPVIPRAFVAQGALGVAIFFALSGFLITVRYRAPLEEKRVSYRTYLTKRFVRIYPVYFFILTFFVVALGRPVGFAPTTLYQGVINYTLIQALFPPLMLSGVSTAWTLTIEELYYLVAPGLMRLMGKVNAPLRQLLLTSIAISIIGFVCVLLLALLPNVLPGFIVGADLSYIAGSSIFGRIPEFLAGMVAGYCYLRRARLPWLMLNAQKLVMPGAVCLLAAITLVQVADEPGAWVLNRSLTILVALCASLVILFLACDEAHLSLISRLLGSRILVFAGQISYVLYLVQLTEPVQYLYWVVLGDTVPRVPRALLLYLGATALSALLYFIVEVPSQHALSRRLLRQ